MARQREENASKATSILEQEKEELIQKNQKMSREVARLMSVDIELDKCKIELRKAVEELQTKEFLVSDVKEYYDNLLNHHCFCPELTHTYILPCICTYCPQ